MIIGISIILTSIIYNILVLIMYFSKPRMKDFENKVYGILLTTSFIGLVLELLCCLGVKTMETYPMFNLIVNKLFLCQIFIWLALFTIYIYSISFLRKEEKLEKYKKYFNIYIPITALLMFIMVLLPIDYFNNNGVVYSQGVGVNYLIGFCVICIIIWISCVIKNAKVIAMKKYTPAFVFIVFIILSLTSRLINPGILLVSSTLALVTVLMFFTIENPDLKLIAELNIAKDQAEKANNAKTDFLSSMSHEIRTPLNAIVGFSNGLLEDEMPIQAREDVKNIISSSNSLLEIVNGILDISKIEANKLEIINTNYNFDNLFNELVNLTKSRIGDKKIDFQYKYDPSIPKYLHGDEVRLKQIVLNLLTNSAKYTTKGHIQFNISAIKNNNNIRLIISVEDTGLGIKEEHINKLFSKFERLGVERNTTAEGTGLGLAITKKLVELMHGKIFLQSLYGVGSRFTILIDQALISSEEYEKLEAIYTETLVTETLNANGKKILVVDDNSMNLKVAERLLKKYNVNVELISSGFECIDKINSGAKYDLILMDDMMPKMSGVETYKKLRENPNFKIPTVVLTANAISGMREKYLAEGFYDYLSKPIEKEELNRVLKKYLS